MAVNGLQLYKTKWHSGFTKQNHLSRAYLTDPEVISTIVHRIFGMQGQNPLQYLTSGMGRAKELGNREYDWFLQGDDEKAIKILKFYWKKSGLLTKMFWYLTIDRTECELWQILKWILLEDGFILYN